LSLDREYESLPIESPSRSLESEYIVSLFIRCCVTGIPDRLAGNSYPLTLSKDHSMYFYRTITLCALLVAGISGCTSSTSTKNAPVDNTGSTVKPKEGSTYTIALYSTDSAGTKIAGTDNATVYTVSDTSKTYNGKSGVWILSSAVNTNFIRYEDNGDVSFYDPQAKTGTGIGTWVTLPNSTKTSVPYPPTDTIIQGVSVQITGTISYVGYESVAVLSQSVPASKFRIMLHTVQSNSGATDETVDSWYAPSIGYFVKQIGSYVSRISAGGFTYVTKNGFVQTMTAFTLK
jgi:hypothetical protein